MMTGGGCNDMKPSLYGLRLNEWQKKMKGTG